MFVDIRKLTRQQVKEVLEAARASAVPAENTDPDSLPRPQMTDTQSKLDEIVAEMRAKVEERASSGLLACGWVTDWADRLAALKAAEPAAGFEDAFTEARDTILHGRHSLEGMLDSDQTNAVLDVLDKMYEDAHTPPQPAAIPSDGEIYAAVSRAQDPDGHAEIERTLKAIAPAAVEDEREAFERWAGGPPFEMCLEKHEDGSGLWCGEYVDAGVQRALEAWLARAALSAQPAAGLTPTREMIEAGAKAIVSWDDNSKWPDSWTPAQVLRARRDAERAWRAMSLVARPQAQDACPVRQLADQLVRRANHHENKPGRTDLDSGMSCAYFEAANMAHALANRLARPDCDAMPSVDIDAAVQAFLGWELPRNFCPDAGISFKPPSFPNGWPTGTNLLNAQQARQMIEHILSAAFKPAADEPPVVAQPSVERMARAIYERIVYAGEPVQTVLDDYSQPEPAADGPVAPNDQVQP